MLLILLLLTALFCAVVGALTGNWMMLVAAAVMMAAAMARLNSAGGRKDLQAVQRLTGRVLGSHWQIVFGAGLLSAGSAAYVAAVYGDPNPAAIVLWLSSILLFLVSGLLHDRKSHLWRRLLIAAHLDRYDWLAMAILTAAALLLRIYQLDAGLPAIHGDEGEMGMYARLALFGPGGERGELPLPYFRTAFLDHPTLFHFVQAAALALFGNTMYSLKLLSAIVGALCTPLIYIIGRVGWGRAAGLSAAWLLAVSHLHIQYSRIALNNIETVWFVILFVALLLLIDLLGDIKRGDAKTGPTMTSEMPSTDKQDAVLNDEVLTHQPSNTSSESTDRRLTLFVLLGLTVGLSQYFYYGSRLLPVLAAPLLLLLWRAKRASMRDLMVAGLSAIAVYLPLLHFYTQNLPAFLNRSRGVGVFSQEAIQHALGADAVWPDDWQKLLLHQIQENVGFFVRSGDRSAFYMPEIPAFDLVTIAFFWLGLGVLASQWRRFPAQAVLMWLLLGVLLGGVTTVDPPNAPRLIVAAPAVFVIAGAAIQQLYDMLPAVWLQRQQWVAAAAMLLLFIVTFQINFIAYFDHYARLQPFRTREVLSHLIAEHAATHRSVLMGAPNLYANHGAIRFIAEGSNRSDLFSVDEFPSQMEAAAAARQDILLIATGEHLDEMEIIRQQHPGGEFGEYFEKPDQIGFAYYLLPSP